MRTERVVRHGDLKYLHRRLEDGTLEEYLFDLASDSAEEKNLLASHPSIAERLKKLLNDWERQVRPVR